MSFPVAVSSVAEVALSEGAHLSAKVRLGEPELVEEAGSRSIGLRVMCGQKVAVTYTSDLSEAGLTRFVEDALELAQLSQPDPFAGPPPKELLSTRDQHPDLDLFDPEVDEIGCLGSCFLPDHLTVAATGSSVLWCGRK